MVDLAALDRGAQNCGLGFNRQRRTAFDRHEPQARRIVAAACKVDVERALNAWQEEDAARARGDAAFATADERDAQEIVPLADLYVLNDILAGARARARHARSNALSSRARRREGDDRDRWRERR
ncbi:MAG: hypothetical protein R3C55_02970 [Parvularculaceae bacterium]